MIETPPYMLIQGDAREIPLADGCVQTVVCSPPYFGLRDYGTAKWEGGDAACDHAPTSGIQGKSGARADRTFTGEKPQKSRCSRCGAVRIDLQIGLEATPDEFVAALVGVFRECWRVLSDDGVMFLNLGDSYVANASNQAPQTKHHIGSGHAGANRNGRTGLKPKDRIGIPHRVVFALQADGWYWRDEIVWHKPNPMPESVRDRTTKSHEMVFLLTKNERYFYDADAVFEAFADKRMGNPNGGGEYSVGSQRMDRGSVGTGIWTKGKDIGGRNARSVWSISSQPYSEAHFATFPPKLAERCIKAGSRPGDVVFDPFSGAGTTAMVACLLGRKGVGIDLNADYLAMAQRRIEASQRPVSRLDHVATEPLSGQLSLFGEGA